MSTVATESTREAQGPKRADTALPQGSGRDALAPAVYTPDDLPAFDPKKELGRPGEYPFTRGIHETMYRGRLWTMRQFAGFGRPQETNARFRYLLAQGQNGLSTAFDLPTLMGLDS